MAKKASPPTAQVLLERKQTNCPLTWIITPEEYRAFNETRHTLLKNRLCKTVYKWSAAGVLVDTVSEVSTESNAGDPGDVINWFCQRTPSAADNPDHNCHRDVGEYNVEESPLDKSVLCMFDLASVMVDETKSGHSQTFYARRLKDAMDDLMAGFRSIFIFSHTPDLPPELKHYCEVIEYELPDLEMAKVSVRNAAATRIVNSKSQIPQIDINDEDVHNVGQELLGLTIMEMDETLAMANRRNVSECMKNPAIERRFDMNVIRDVKAQAIRRSGTIELMDSPGGLDLFGGGSALKEELDQMKRDLCTAAREDGIPAPKGLLMVGPGGTGKTLMAKCIGHHMDMQVAALDIGACKGSFVGQSEGNLRAALKMIDRISPVVLFVDEFEKMLGGSTGGQNLDSGTSSNMLQTWLRWMQDGKDEGVIVIAACNDVRTLPPPAIRAGRFDEIVYVGLPAAGAREDIVNIHLNKRGWNLEDMEDVRIKQIVASIRGYSGAEIERVVVKALRNKVKRLGFGRDKFPNMEDFVSAVEGVTPLSKTHIGDLVSLEEWAQEVSAIRASKETPDFRISREDGVQPTTVSQTGNATGAGNRSVSRELDMSHNEEY